MREMVLYFWESDARSGASHRQVYWQTNYCVRDSNRMDITILSTTGSLAPRDKTNFFHPRGQHFGVKYVGKEHAEHLINCLKEEAYKLTEDWTGNIYCGISLRWDYKAQRLDISMPGYIKKQLLKYEHIMQRIQHCP